MEDPAFTRSLGAVVKARRQQLGWSQEELARRVVARGDATFRQSDVSRLERGKVALPHHDRLAHIAAVLGLSTGELLARSGWANADVAFTAHESRLPTAAHGAVDAAEASLEPLQTATTLSGGARRADLLIAQARATRERAQELMQQCEETRVLVDRVMGTARQSQGGEAETQ